MAYLLKLEFCSQHIKDLPLKSCAFMGLVLILLKKKIQNSSIKT